MTLRTPGQIAEECGEPVHRVLYAIRSRNIEPDGRAGIIRLFGPSKIRTIKKALEETHGTATGANGRRRVRG